MSRAAGGWSGARPDARHGRGAGCDAAAWAAALAVAATCAAAPAAALPPCPAGGAVLGVALVPPADAPDLALVAGELLDPSCEPAAGAPLSTSYAGAVLCDGSAGRPCRRQWAGLAPGRWLHQVLSPRPRGVQLQGRQGALLAASAGVNEVSWRLYETVLTVGTLDDGPGCSGCLREALTEAVAAAPPVLVQFTPGLRGDVLLSAPLPAITADRITLDGSDLDGSAWVRTVDGGGMDAPLLRIEGGGNEVIGLRLANGGGNADLLVIEGPQASGNLLADLEVAGRAAVVCGADREGCLVDGVCQTPATHGRNGSCGDDGIAVRGRAGRDEPNRIRGCRVRGAYDKGIKVSEEAVAIVENCDVSGNRDGGIQATLGGSVEVRESRIAGNAGTASASGLAANGAAAGGSTPARLRTRGNLIIGNALRGVSGRRRSELSLSADWICGNGVEAGPNGFGWTLGQVDGQPLLATASGLALVGNAGGALVTGTAEMGIAGGENLFAYNGPPASRRNLVQDSLRTLDASGNHWEGCGRSWRCDERQVLAGDVVDLSGTGVVVGPALPSFTRRAPVIEEIAPSRPVAGEVVRIYGRGFDAVAGNAMVPPCSGVPEANTCRPLRGNCVRVGGVAARVVAVTPRMLAFEMPHACVGPTDVVVRTRFARGGARARICVLPPPGNATGGSPTPVPDQESKEFP